MSYGLAAEITLQICLNLPVICIAHMSMKMTVVSLISKEIAHSNVKLLESSRENQQ